MVPYAASNFLEDFAVTMESYYSVTRFGDAYVAEVHQTAESRGSPVLFTYSAVQALKASPAHKQKACAFAQAVLGEPCGL